MWVYGSGGHGRVVASILRSEAISFQFVNDATYELWKEKMLEGDGIIAIGENKARELIVSRADMKAMRYRTVEARNSVNLGTLGPGTLLAWGAHLGPGATVGNHSILNTSSSVDHDCMIGSFVHIAPGARLCGGVTVGDGTLIGAGAIVLPNLRIGPWLKIPAGAIVSRSIESAEPLELLREARDRRGY